MTLGRSVFALALFGAATAASAAMAGPLDTMFGNTVVVTLPNKAQVKYFINADATYAAAAPDGSTIKGTWALKGDTLCLTQTGPTAVAETCNAVEAHKVGDTWTVPGPDKSLMSLTLVAGR